MQSPAERSPRSFRQSVPFMVSLIISRFRNVVWVGALLSEAYLDTMKFVLTFAVPCCVATYRMVSYRLRAAPLR